MCSARERALEAARRLSYRGYYSAVGARALAAAAEPYACRTLRRRLALPCAAPSPCQTPSTDPAVPSLRALHAYADSVSLARGSRAAETRNYRCVYAWLSATRAASTIRSAGRMFTFRRAPTFRDFVVVARYYTYRYNLFSTLLV